MSGNISKQFREFHSSKRSIARADIHINDLKQRIDRLNDDTASMYTVIREPYGNRTHEVVKAKLIAGAVPFEELTMVIIDSIYNLRSSMDQMIYSALSILKSQENTGIDLTRAKFPVCKSKAGFEERIGRLESRNGFPDGVASIIRAQKPYLDGEFMSPLCALNDLANINKHRFLLDTNVRANLFSLNHIRGPKTIGGYNSFSLGGGGHRVNTTGDAPIGEDEIGLYLSSIALKTEYKVDITIDMKFRDVVGLQPFSCLYHLNSFRTACANLIEGISDIMS